jgi:hypothetical protein
VPLAVRDGLGNRSVAVTQIYLSTSADRVETCMRKTDWGNGLEKILDFAWAGAVTVVVRKYSARSCGDCLGLGLTRENS